VIVIRRAKEYQGIVSIYFENMHHLLYHSIILDTLSDDLKCELLSYDDLITDIDCKLRWNGIEFSFNHHYMFGNHIVALPDNADALEKLANQAADIINERIGQG